MHPNVEIYLVVKDKMGGVKRYITLNPEYKIEWFSIITLIVKGCKPGNSLENLPRVSYILGQNHIYGVWVKLKIHWNYYKEINFNDLIN